MRGAIAAALLLAAGNAWALGLGQIEVKSRRNQPLLAEITIISTTPGELEALQESSAREIEALRERLREYEAREASRREGYGIIEVTPVEKDQD